MLVVAPLMTTLVLSAAAGLLVTQPVLDNARNTLWTTAADRTQALELIETTRTVIAISVTVVIGLALIGTLLRFRNIQRPLEKLTEAATRISRGDFVTPVPRVSADLDELADTLEQARRLLRTSLTEAARQAKMEAELLAEGKHNDELSVLLALSQLLLTANDEATVLNLTVETAAELLNTERSSIVLPDDKTGELTICAVHGWLPSTLGEKLGRGTESQTGYTLMQGRPVAVDDYRAPLPFATSIEPDIVSGLSVPMAHENRIVGALFVHSRKPRHFEQDDIRLLSLVANQGAAALERARLYAQSVHQANELRTLARIGEALNRAETADTTLRLVLTEALKLVNTDQGCIILVEPDDFTLRLYTWLGIPDADVQRFNERQFQKYHGVFARSILRGEMVEIGELATESGESFKYADTLLPQKINVPLKTEDKTIGAIALNGLPPDDQSRRMVLALADLAATAIAKTRLYERTQVLAITDDLTGLYNRRGFNELGQREFERARRFDRALVTIMFDIDNFKNVNDTYGHAVGNQVLTLLAELCRGELREVDLLGRYGGEEFVVLLPETNIDGGHQAAERLRRAVAKSVHTLDQGQMKITISLGVAVLAGSDESLAETIDRADQALYVAKRTGRNRVCVWSTELMATQLE